MPHGDSGETPGVSVVVCSRDRSELLATSLAAVTQALRPQDELIVVDSASRDDRTGQVARAAGARVVRCSLPGLSRARNAGVAVATRPVVVFTDDDCRPVGEWVAPLEHALRDPVVGVATGAVRPVGRGFLSGIESDAVQQSYPLTGNPVGHGANMAVRRADLLSVGGFDELLGAGARLAAADDWDVFLRLVRGGRTLTHVPASAVEHEQWRGSQASLRVRHGYSLGAGALAAKCWRWGGPGDRRQARQLVVGRLVEGGRAVLVGVMTLRWFRAAAGAVTLAGLARGVAAGLRRPLTADGLYLAADPA